MASIKQRGPNSYLITVSVGRDINGKKIFQTATFKPDPDLTPKKREKAVADFAHDFEQQVLNGVAMDGRKVTLKEFTERWLNDYAAQELEGRTIDGYNLELTDRILPFLGHLKLSDIRPTTVNAFIASMTKEGVRKDGKPGGYSKATVKHAFNVLSSILRTAVEWELIEKNPCDNVRVRVHDDDAADKIKFFTPEQAAEFLDYIEKPYIIQTKGHNRIDDTGKGYHVADYDSIKILPLQIRVLFNLALFAGLRKGELLALQWPDIDFEADTVSITKAASMVGGNQIVKAPKTKSGIRDVNIPHFLTLRLKELKAEQTRYRLSIGDRWQGDGWIFTQADGRMMNYSTPYSTFQDTLKRYNEGKPEDQQLPVIPFHGLRHTSATVLIANHADIKTVQNRLGHAEASTTMNIYAHALQETDRKAASLLENALTKQA